MGAANEMPARLRSRTAMVTRRERTPEYYGGEAGRSRLLGAAVEDVVRLDVLNGRTADEIDRVGEPFDTTMVVPTQHRGVLHHKARVVVPETRDATRVGKSDEKFFRIQVVCRGVVEIFEQHERRAERVVDIADRLSLTVLVAQPARRNRRDVVEIIDELVLDVAERTKAPILEPLTVDAVVEHGALNHGANGDARPELHTRAGQAAGAGPAHFREHQLFHKLVVRKIGHVIAAIV